MRRHRQVKRVSRGPEKPLSVPLMTGLKILITTFRCSLRSGLEVYVRDLALGLRERGHVPFIYSPQLGELAQELRSMQIPVVDDLKNVGLPPDIVHGHHHLETMTALLHFSAVPAIYFCHDWFNGLDSPPMFPRLLRYVAVDQPCYEKLIFEHAVPEARVRLMLNFVDGERFKARAPLPPHPARALVYDNYSRDDANLAAVREACLRSGLQLDVVGLGMRNACVEPETLLGQYDIVFAKSRAAAEALAVGTAVVIYCMRSVGPMVTLSELQRLLPLNFGFRAMRHHSTADTLTQDLIREIARYDAQDAAEVSSRVRTLLDRDRAIDEILSLYEETIAEHRNAGPPGADAEGRAAAEYIRWLSSRVRDQFNILVDSPVVVSEAALENVSTDSAAVSPEPPLEEVLID